LLQGIAEGYIPRMVYAIGLGQVFLVVVSLLFDRDRELNCNRNLAMKTVDVLSALSPTIIILLLGKQGSLIALALQELFFYYSFGIASNCSV
jgi:phosphatidylinositol glycan class O